MGKILNLKILRDQTGLNSICPEFSIFMEESGTKMMVGNKKFGSSTSNFYITLESGIDSVKHEYFIAKLRSNFWNSIYNVYTRGSNPKNAALNETVRTIEATILFRTNKDKKEPRNFEVYTLNNNTQYNELSGVKKGEEISLDQLF